LSHELAQSNDEHATFGSFMIRFTRLLRNPGALGNVPVAPDRLTKLVVAERFREPFRFNTAAEACTWYSPEGAASERIVKATEVPPTGTDAFKVPVLHSQIPAILGEERDRERDRIRVDAHT